MHHAQSLIRHEGSIGNRKKDAHARKFNLLLLTIFDTRTHAHLSRSYPGQLLCAQRLSNYLMQRYFCGRGLLPVGATVNLCY